MWHRRQARDHRDELEEVLDQLERAELYVVAAAGVDLGDPERNQALERLRAELAATRRSLASPRVVSGGARS